MGGAQTANQGRSVECTVSSAVYDSLRVRQVAAMFDMRVEARTKQSFAADLPDLSGDWRIGLVLGPCGSGKSTIGRRVFGANWHRRRAWPARRAVVDCLGDLETSEVVRLFTAVGFGSPPSWIKPYRVLSGGERFRCELARALAAAITSGGRGLQSTDSPPREWPVVAFDEYSSLVDRAAARISSAALSKAIRGGGIACRFVAVTCHDDVAAWLEPDWVLDMSGGRNDWSRLRRPTMRLEVYRCRQAMWQLFARHHYLSGSLNRGARSYVARWGRLNVAFCATLPLVARRRHWRISRLVTLPDYQGMGIGMRLAETVAEVHRLAHDRVSVTASHPALLFHCRRSTRWKLTRVMESGGRRCGFTSKYSGSTGRAVVSFEYVGAAPQVVP